MFATSLVEMAWQGARLALAVGASAAAVYVVAGTTWTASQTYSRIIFWDMWTWIITLREWLESGFTWSSLFALINGHRHVVTRLLLFLDYWLDHQNGGLMIALMLAQYFAAVGALVMLFRRAAESEDTDWIGTIVFTAFAGVMLFAGPNLENLQFAFQVAYIWAFMAMPVAALTTVLSIEASKRGSDPRAACLIALTIFVCAIATYSNGGGMLIWPVILFLAYSSGAPRRHLAAIVIAAVICVGGYFIGYHSDGPASDPVQMLGKAETYTLFLPLLLANPFAPEFGLVLAQGVSPHDWFAVFGWVGIFGVAAVTVTWVSSQLARRPWQPAQLALFAILIYAVAVGSAIVLVRANWGWVGAIIDRYRALSALFWIAGFMLLVSLPWHPRGRKRAVLLAAGSLMAIMMIFIVAHQRDSLKFYSARHQRWLVTADALRVGVTDWQAYGTIDWLPDASLLPLIQFIRDRELSVFSDGRFKLVGKSFDRNFRSASDKICSGQVDETMAIPEDLNAWRLSGSVRGIGAQKAPQYLLLVDNATNRIAGLGTDGLSLLDIPGSPSRNFVKHDGWAGYVRSPPGTVIAIYGVASDGKSACHIAETRLGLAAESTH